MTLRIVHLGKYYHPHAGGIETHVRTLAAVQAARGNEVHVVCVSHDRSLDPTDWDGAVSVRRFVPRWSFAKLEWVSGVSRYLDDLHCDVLHIHVPNPTMTLAVLNMATKIPLVATYHSDIVGMPLRRWMFGPWERRLMSRAAAIGATNPRMADESACLALHRERVRIVPMGIALDRFVEPRPKVVQKAAQIRQGCDGPLWLMCGRLVRYKGHAVALEALRHVRGTLAIIGDGPLRRELQRQAQRLQLGDRVRFLGRVSNDDVAAHYRVATAYWLPSILPSEAFGLVQVEAMASGCPVINTDIPGSGVSWVSQHDETGLTVPVGDARALAQMSQRLLDEPELRARLSGNARLRAVQEFDQRLMADRWQQVYDEMLDDRVPQRGRRARPRRHGKPPSSVSLPAS